MNRLRLALVTAVVLTLTGCAGVQRPAQKPSAAEPGASLWESPTNLPARDLLYGPWGRERAPDPKATYRLVELKHSGVNRGMTVVDAQGHEWSVKQPYPGRLDEEGPVEVTLSRLLSADRLPPAAGVLHAHLPAEG